jgi:cardiolipin synthase A/B
VSGPRRWAWITATITGLIVGAAWWLVLRAGRRIEPDDGPEPIDAANALAYARRALSPPRPRHADLAHRWARSAAADVEVLPEGRVFYPRMLDDIRAAAQSVHIMQYGFRPGAVADRFAPLLAEKARSGVAVRLVLDAIGSGAYGPSRQMLEDLAAAGAEVMIHDAVPPDRSGPLGNRRRTMRADQAGRVEHRKLVLVDGRAAYIGGAGLEDHFEDGRFHDVYVRVTGPITHQLQALFLASFAYHGGWLPDAADLEGHFPPVTAEGRHPATILMNWPRGWRPLTDAASQLLAGARDRLDIMNPYIGDRQIIGEVVAAARRGVSVRMVVSDEAHGNGVAYAALKHHYDALLEAGVEIWEYPALVHAKVIVADDRAMVGTLNLDAWAMYRNPEMGLIFDDAGIADQFRHVLFEPDIAASVRGRPATGRFRRARNRAYARASYLL